MSALIDKVSIVETAFAPLQCSCQPDGTYYQIRISQPHSQGEVLLYDARHPMQQLDSLRTTAQLVLEIRQRLAADSGIGAGWERAGLLG
ncbi:DUF1652 domain-containing protein [Pseudomonas matsuisoli]|uniref:DUF1652 domain-containing protein n=1 Tax=Pseudomonas matsuisoli TaxID=1515666 RepID=A0A917PU79_9PSED|nr:DUF1652 domain-containing protein [Pseudomonas matsuisoli]GGJ92127.1 hypothetical protein GCM10009304_17390 [Pseudomonas matsuisoli]